MKEQAGTSYWKRRGLGMRAANILVDLDIRSLSELRRLTPYEFYALASSRGCGRGTLLEVAACARWRLDEDAVTEMVRDRYRQGVWRVTRAGRPTGQSAGS